MRLTDFIPAGCVVTDAKCKSKDSLFKDLAKMIAATHPGCDAKELVAAVLDRESKISTGIGNGIAIPHGKTDSVHGLCGAIAIFRDGIEYEAVDGLPVRVVFMLLAPFDSAGPHIRALQQIAILSKDHGFIERLVNAASNGEAHDLLVEEEIRQESER